MSIACVSVAETTAEKVLSLLRRCAYQWDGHQTKGEMSRALVRMFMTWPASRRRRQDRWLRGKDIFERLVMGDRAEFRNQNPEFLCHLTAAFRAQRCLVPVERRNPAFEPL
ncbi:hypothetical protein [Variovorax sp. ZT4R33]|uniref:hypothetical protein n=1 Tax=Variovorax sp. ZT4R33 TaxID=3443743 RepID=UPI003F490E86